MYKLENMSDKSNSLKKLLQRQANERMDYLYPVRPTKNAESLKRAEKKWKKEINEYYAGKEAENAETHGNLASGKGWRGVRALRRAMSRKKSNSSGGGRRRRTRRTRSR